MPLPTPTQNPFFRFARSFSSWSFAIKNASSPYNALCLYSQMHRRSIPFDSFSMLFTLRSCAALRDHNIIRHLHSHIFKLGFATHVYVATSLLNAYVLGSFNDACKLFDEMPDRNNITWNIMITGHSNSGSIDKARAAFEAAPFKDVGAWSAMIAAYMDYRKWDSGFRCFRDMMANDGLKPDQVALGSVLWGCAQMGSLGLLVGKSLHGFIVKNGWELSVKIGTILVDMYAKCGFLKYAGLVFHMMQERNVIAWTALICGAAEHGNSNEALTLFECMQKMGVRPNEMTFTGILNACAHTVLVEDGRRYFKMIEEYGLEPRIQHYGCMIALFGKVGLLEEAYEVIRTMKFEPNVVIWGSFLSACKDHKHFEMADRVMEQVLRTIKPESDGGVYSLLADIFVLNEKWYDAERVRKLMVNKNVRKVRGSSFTIS